MSRILDFPESTLTWLGKRRYVDWIPDKTYIKMMYFFKEGKKIDLKEPKTLNEKLQWIKLYDRNSIYTDMVDKITAKEIVKEKLGPEYIIKTLGIWNDPEKIDYDKLPERFVLKANHDSHSLIICKDKKTLDITKVTKQLKDALKMNGFWYGREWPYKNVEPQILAEEYVENCDGSPLTDYKFYCYGGKPIYFMCSYGEAEHHVKNHKFNMELESIDYLFKEKMAISASDIKMPNNICDMIKVVEKLCAGFKHIRIDLYNADGKILFGEFTFFSSSGFMHITSKEYSNYLASLIDLNI